MAEIVASITQCEPIAGSDRTLLRFQGEAGSYSFELTPQALDGLLRGMLGQKETGQDTAATNAVTPLGCQPFESTQGLCGLAFKLGDRWLHIVVPPSGIRHVRMALNAVEDVYAKQQPAGKPD
jgi:hypothetical protein